MIVSKLPVIKYVQFCNTLLSLIEVLTFRVEIKHSKGDLTEGIAKLCELSGMQ